MEQQVKNEAEHNTCSFSSILRKALATYFASKTKKTKP